VADEGNYGEKGIAAFENLAKKSGRRLKVCFSNSFCVPNSKILKIMALITSAVAYFYFLHNIYWKENKQESKCPTIGAFPKHSSLQNEEIPQAKYILS